MIQAVVSKQAKIVPTDGALLSQFSVKVLGKPDVRLHSITNEVEYILASWSLGFWVIHMRRLKGDFVNHVWSKMYLELSKSNQICLKINLKLYFQSKILRFGILNLFLLYLLGEQKVYQEGRTFQNNIMDGPLAKSQNRYEDSKLLATLQIFTGIYRDSAVFSAISAGKTL